MRVAVWKVITVAEQTATRLEVGKREREDRGMGKKMIEEGEEKKPWSQQSAMYQPLQNEYVHVCARLWLK